MATKMTPSGTPRPMPILAEVLRPPGGGGGKVGCVVEKTNVDEASEVEAGRDERVDTGAEVDMRGEVDTGEEVGMGEGVNTEKVVKGETGEAVW